MDTLMTFGFHKRKEISLVSRVPVRFEGGPYSLESRF